MQFKLIGKNDYLINPIKIILNNRGIDNIDEFLNVKKEHTYHYSLLDNITNTVKCLLTHIHNNNIIYLQVDSDVDGYTSASLLYNYIKRVFPKSNIVYNIHEGKEHGIVLEKIPDDVSLVIIPDAGTNQYEEMELLKKRNIDCIVLDHHEAENSIYPSGLIVNNQTCDYPNKSFSGAGIVYKFCKALDVELNINYADDYLDLVALGNIADVMDMRSLETRYYALQGLQKINNPFMIALYNKQSFSTKGIVNIINTAFYIAPLINACIRFGDRQEKENMFKAFIGSSETLPYKKRGSKEEIQEPISQAMARICVNIKTRQNNARDKSLEVIEKRIQEKKLFDNKILIVDVTEILENTLTGLVATQLANKYKRPVILLRYNEKEDLMGGSARGYDKGIIKDFKKALSELNLFEYTLGHSNAFGIGISIDNIIEANDVLNRNYCDVIFEDIYDVDFIISSSEISKELVLNIDKYCDIWSHGIEEPLVAFSDITIGTNDINIMGEKQNTIKLKYKDIEFIKFGCSEEEVKKVKDGHSVSLDIVGKCKSNEWNGNISAQVIISDFDIKKSKKFIF